MNTVFSHSISHPFSQQNLLGKVLMTKNGLDMVHFFFIYNMFFFENYVLNYKKS